MPFSSTATYDRNSSKSKLILDIASNHSPLLSKSLFPDLPVDQPKLCTNSEFNLKVGRNCYSQ